MKGRDRIETKTPEQGVGFAHVPIMVEEIIQSLGLGIGDIVVDATLGGGGHSIEIAKRIAPRGQLIGIDQDSVAISATTQRFEKELSGFKGFHAVQSNFSDLSKVLKSLSLDGVDAILADLGVSSHQIDRAERGFSYMADGPLDMRMNPSQKFTARELVNTAKESYLKLILKEYGEERFSGRIARAIVEARPLETTGQLREVIEHAVPGSYYKTGGHPAKRTFQALRIEVNRELESLETFMRVAIASLKPKGRLAVITFHSLEDRIVKQTLKHHASSCLCPPKIPKCICGHKASVKILTKKPITPSTQEQKKNPRSTSAKLRVAEKL